MIDDLGRARLRQLDRMDHADADYWRRYRAAIEGDARREELTAPSGRRHLFEREPEQGVTLRMTTWQPDGSWSRLTSYAAAGAPPAGFPADGAFLPDVPIQVAERSDEPGWRSYTFVPEDADERARRGAAPFQTLARELKARAGTPELAAFETETARLVEAHEGAADRGAPSPLREGLERMSSTFLNAMGLDLAQITAMFTPPSDQVAAIEAQVAELRRRSEAAGWQDAPDDTPATPMMDRWRLTRASRVREIAAMRMGPMPMLMVTDRERGR